ncbi:ethylene-responsive transcription factor ERF026 [Sesamum indicum]|uniref:Ethylene-responsive transcription factor ERF026 n=1 Tax=Sesamum indicum TaxID=4182 RepID=A0A6I9TJM7_SESIN|nr:ethylene-responsive transcription factor ERF026 [Sesamum indicum]
MADSPHHPNMSRQDPPHPNQQPFTSPPPPPPPLPPPPAPPPPPSRDQSSHLQPTITSEELPSPKKVKKSSTSSSGSPSRPAAGKHPLYRGIRSRSGKWVSEIREPKKTTRIWLGTYPSPEMAAAAYDVAALALKGGDTLLNFPDRVGTYPVPASPSPTDIRRAAASAAALMKPESSGEAAADGGQQGHDESVSNEETLTSGHEFIDEEALFHMPNLLMDMAEGMLVSPPRMASPPSDDSPDNSDAENLWSYF